MCTCSSTLSVDFQKEWIGIISITTDRFSKDVAMCGQCRLPGSWGVLVFQSTNLLSIPMLSTFIFYDNNCIDHQHAFRSKASRDCLISHGISCDSSIIAGPWYACSDTLGVCGNQVIHTITFTAIPILLVLHETHFRPWNLVNYEMLHSALFWSHILTLY